MARGDSKAFRRTAGARPKGKRCIIDRTNRVAITTDYTARAAKKKHTCRRLRAILDDWLDSPRPCPRPGQTLCADQALADLSKKYNRTEEAIYNLLKRFWTRFGKVKDRIGSHYERIEGVRSRLNPGRKPTDRDVYFFHQFGRLWKYDGSKDCDKKFRYTREERAVILGLHLDRIDDLYADRPDPIREAGGSLFRGRSAADKPPPPVRPRAAAITKYRRGKRGG